MKNKTTLSISVLAASAALFTFADGGRRVPKGCDASVMSDAYWQQWTDEKQAAIDADIEANRKADASVAIPAADGTEVKIEQLTHDFRFGTLASGASRIGTPEVNRRFDENLARLFNQATITFYWRGFEQFPGDLHFHTRFGDLETSLASVDRSKLDPHTRYLASPTASTDQSIEFAKSHGMRIHGHPLCWGSYEWMQPHWLYAQYCPDSEKAFLKFPIKDPRKNVRLFGEWEWQNAFRDRFSELFSLWSEEEIAAEIPVYLANMKRLYARRIAEILDYCGDRVDSWDVVNESSEDWLKSSGASCENSKPLTKSVYGLMPPNYALEAFRTAAAHASGHPLLSINDWNVRDETYPGQIADLIDHGARIDMIGVQFHIFQDADFVRLVAGESYKGMSDPDGIRKIYDRLGRFKRPIHLSEITIPSPKNTPEARQQQAIVAYNLYRAWFSQKYSAGITWWHTLDGADKSGGIENGYAGLMDFDASPKPVYNALYELIHDELMTRTSATVKDGHVAFRGFRGRYSLSWRCPRCRGRHERTVELLGDGVSEDVFKKRIPDCRPTVRDFTVEGKKVSIGENEKILDLAKLFPNDVGDSHSNGRRTVEISFSVIAPADGTYEILRFSDWFASYSVNGGEAVESNGPNDRFHPMELKLKKGENRIVVKSRAGKFGKWAFGFQIGSDSPLRLW